MSNTIATRICRTRLATVWLLGSAVLFFVIVAQSLLGKFGTQVEAAWSWFLPSVMPSLSLIVSVLVIDMHKIPTATKKVDRFLFHVTMAISIIYLTMVAVTIFAQPYTQLAPVELMRRSNLWLAPLQGVVAAALGAFFVKGEEA